MRQEASAEGSRSRVRAIGWICSLALLPLCISGAQALPEPGPPVSWGSAEHGQLGRGLETDRSNVPLPVAGAFDAVEVAAGPEHALALTAEGSVWAWGRNSEGQLGNDTTTRSAVPVPVLGLTLVTAIAAGDRHSLAVRLDGSVWAWGSNANGQLGTDGVPMSPVPVQVAGVSSATAVAAGSHSVALRSDGHVMSWGTLVYSPDGPPGFDPTPRDVWLWGISKVAARGCQTLAINAEYSGVVLQWSCAAGDFPEVVELLLHARDIAIGDYGFFLAALRSPSGYSSVYSWGSYAYWVSCWSNADNPYRPRFVPGSEGATAVAAGSSFGAILMNDGGVRVWGSGDGGHFGDGTNTAKRCDPRPSLLPAATRISASGDYLLALATAPQV